jgi:hypothetical protein
VTDTNHETRRFPPIEPIDAPSEMARFMAAMRRLQDIVVSTAPEGELWTDGARRIEELCEQLEVHRAPQGVAPAGRAPHLPGLGHPLVPPWTLDGSGPDGVTMRGHFSRFHVGGVIPLFFDWQFGMIVSAADRPISRTAYLHVDYKKVTPIDESLVSSGRIEKLDGRKAFVTATMTDADGTVPSEANGLMIKLLPHQP